MLPLNHWSPRTMFIFQVNLSISWPILIRAVPVINTPLWQSWRFCDPSIHHIFIDCPPLLIIFDFLQHGIWIFHMPFIHHIEICQTLAHPPYNFHKRSPLCTNKIHFFLCLRPGRRPYAGSAFYDSSGNLPDIEIRVRPVIAPWSISHYFNRIRNHAGRDR